MSVDHDVICGLSLSEMQTRLEGMRKITSVVTSDPSATARNGKDAEKRELEEFESGNETRAAHFNRRGFIQGSTAIMATVAVAGPLQSMMAARAQGETVSIPSPYGEAVPTADMATGLNLLKLPPGFRYRSFSWTGDPMSDGNRTPDVHDGMAVIAQYGPYAMLSRNHEIAGGPSIATGSIRYSPFTGGGCTNLLFNIWTGQFVKAFATLAGTSRNCAGGPTPWGSWLSCEEIAATSGGGTYKHGYVFEVGPFGSNAEPIRAMGRFVHEAVAVDPSSSDVYLTEDSSDTSGLYRFTPNYPGFLRYGGKLQMAKVKGVNNFDFRRAEYDGTEYELEWVDIDNADPDLEGGEARTYTQGFAKGAARFRRLEGIWYGNNKLYIVSTSGGPNTPDSGVGEGIIFELTPPRRSFFGIPIGGEGSSDGTSGGTLKVIYTSPAATTLENPDNIVVSPGGALLICEDHPGVGLNEADRLVGLTLDGQAFTFAQNNMNFSSGGLGSYTRQESGWTFTGDRRLSEWAGATYSYDGEWLFVNIQSPGVTFAITGPWKNGPLGIPRRSGGATSPGAPS